MKWIVFIAALAVASSSYGQDCSLPSEFESHQAALEIVKTTEFRYTYTQDTPRSSWIKAGYYYSCDNKDGFMTILNKEGSELIFQDVPKEKWDGFVNADSYGSYAQRQIIGKYFLKLKGQK